MKSLYNKVVKHNQVTYGNPFQLKMPVNLQYLKIQEEIAAANEEAAADTEVDAAAEMIAKAREEAEFIAKEAEYEANRLLESAESEARAKAAEIEEQAWQKGYSEGLEAAKQQYEDLLREAEEIRNNAIEEHNHTLAFMESEIMDMTLEITRKVIGAEFKANPENIVLVVRQAIEKCSNRNNIIIKVSRDDYDYLKENTDKLMSMVQGVGEMDIRQDLTLKSGDCIVETPFGSVNAGVDTKFGKIEQAFRAMMEERMS